MSDAAGVVAVLAATACNAGPSYTLHDGWYLNVPNVSNTGLLLGQHGTAVAGYDLATGLTSYPAPVGELVCGQVVDGYVHLYLPPDSSSIFSGSFKDALTVVGTVTGPAGPHAATMQGGYHLLPPPVLDTGLNGIGTNNPLGPPSHC